MENIKAVFVGFSAICAVILLIVCVFHFKWVAVVLVVVTLSSIAIFMLWLIGSLLIAIYEEIT